ncbi:MAG: hypothetical protein IPK82_19260 [Polyangiaceae bacterium]|nr:hypothetical protein [Polyangiaceae bacterium]
MKSFPRSLPAFLLAAVGVSACAGVLGIRPPGRRPFEHREHTVKGVSCIKCHAGVASAGDTGPLHMPGAETCSTAECHQKPHDTNDCTQCHGLSGTRAAAALARETIHFDHGEHMSRVKGDCVRCHVDVKYGAERLRPAMATCFGCHNHATEMVVRKCDGCHVDLEKEGIKPDEQWVHGPDFMKEHGVRAATASEVCNSCHAEKFCTGCHSAGLAPATPARLNPDNPFTPSVHRAGFFARHADEARGAPGLCTTCHSQAMCTGCHQTNNLVAGAGNAKSPHPRGWLGLPGQQNDHGRSAWRDPGQCATCHGGAGEALCVGCHKVGGLGGNPHPPGYVAHGDSKRDVACRACHGGGL